MVYRPSGLRSLGLIQIFIGVLMVVFGICAMAAVHHWSSFSACGLWIGTWVILTGVFGYLGSKSDDRPNTCLIGLMIGFSATACVFTGIMFIIYCIALSEFSQRIRCGEHGKGTDLDCRLYGYEENISYSLAKVGAGVGAILLILALVEFFVALTSSVYGCNASCCGTTTTAGVVQANQQVTYLNQPGQNVTVLSSSHGTVLPPGSTVQTFTTYPGQPMVLQTGNPQMIPSGGVQTFQNSYPVQPGIQTVQHGYFPPPPYAGGTTPQQ
ncbi:membrane-spanning 4-domains subfamily A member 8-like [Actinia tenebrosa]|uniref:Membrane-spanning 4-domains subfamily A member 8-like n=1 Tax=Actinia tenebrosa TaxID=6105 RepID=A0A6P8J2A6_ACTTE|nr:membrane-spanning 4-domains subfamily A member 8-like [Actinia tenebrosa]